MATEEDRVAITLFDRPVVSISVKGRSRIFNCGDKS
jgi:hypothetical protein